MKRAFFVWLVCALGCAPTAVPDMTTRDSSGVRIVESTKPSWSDGEGWVIDSEPTLDLSTVATGPAHEFFRVTDATRLPDGSIVVADRGASEVRRFSSEGNTMWIAGRDGEGPGEFSRLSQVASFREDSIAAFDFWLGRITVIALDGKVGRTIPSYDNDVQIRYLHVLDDSTFVGETYGRGGSWGTDGPYRINQTLVQISADSGELLDTVTDYAGFEGYIFSLGDMFPMFGKSGHVATHGGRIFLGTADSLEFSVYDSGRLAEIVRIPGYDLSLSEDEIAAERMARTPSADLPARFTTGITDALDAMEPTARPAYDHLIVDSEGYVWLAEFNGLSGVDEDVNWNVFDPSGVWLGDVRMPSHYSVYEIGIDYVLGKWTDVLDVEHVRLLSLTRRDPRR